jgi:LAS superfamily LD-carboxypeptidase LdcB
LDPIGHGGLLEATAARAWNALWLQAQTDGIDLTWSPGGAYRPYWQQAALFMQRWDNTRRGTEHCWYAGAEWWLLPHVARAAVPGTSNHGLGLAMDVALGTEPAAAQPITHQLPWLLSQALEFGFSWELDSEPWHIRYFPGDEIPQAVLASEAAAALAS